MCATIFPSYPPERNVRVLTPLARLLRSLGPLALALASLADVWHVNSEANRRGQDGKSWKTAFTAIQLAIDAAHSDGGGDIWIAKGVYPRR